MTVPYEFGFFSVIEDEGFVPTDADYEGDPDRPTCVECGGFLDSAGECEYCDGDAPFDGERDFPLADEYEGAFGLSGYDPFYDTVSDYDY